MHEYGGAIRVKYNFIEAPVGYPFNPPGIQCSFFMWQSPDVSYYVTQCFQHIYFATSTLWGEGNIFGTDPVNLGIELLSFS